MSSDSGVDAAARGGATHSVGGGPSRLALVVYVCFVILLTGKVLWGYWERDLTFGDTSSYFNEAARWYRDGQVNIVWSPLYTAYFGSWLNVTENAGTATFLHRIGLIIASVGLVAWLGWISLPRAMAMVLVAWWIALPIHYDTLYEVHLFGALPVLAMAVVVFAADSRWRAPILLSIALVGTFLVRNEYVLAVGVLIVVAFVRLLLIRKSVSWPALVATAARHGVMLFLAGLVIAYFYAVSYVKGRDIVEWSRPKHTLNMCQVYAYGYQQRYSNWMGSPWTDCSALMQRQFGAPQPTLGEMIVANPWAVAEHFVWNLSLTRSGAEVLLFNVTSSKYNPDYAPVSVFPLVPTLLLSVVIMVGVAGSIVTVRASGRRGSEVREKLAAAGPLLLAAGAMAIAVIVTQRPRPSYLLGQGVLIVWAILLLSTVMTGKLEVLDRWWAIGVVGVVCLFFAPAYKTLSVSSKGGSLGVLYDELRPQARQLCKAPGELAVNEYGSEVASYLCALIVPNKRSFSVGGLPVEALASAQTLAGELERVGVGAVIIDPFLAARYAGLKGCPEMRDAFLARGWRQLAYSFDDGGRCIAAYAR